MLLVYSGRSLVRESVDILGDRFLIEISGDRFCGESIDILGDRVNQV